MVSPQGDFTREAVERLADLVDQSLDETVRYDREADGPTDAFLSAGDTVFMLDCRTATYTAALHHAIRSLKARVPDAQASGVAKLIVPVLAVPFMGPAGRSLCREESCSWLDLSGNANIHAPGLFVRLEGNPNRFKRRGRRASAFAPVASRVVRHMLTHPMVHFSQRHLAQVTGMDEGYVSRVVRNLADQGLVARRDKAVRVLDADLLLRAWLDEYDFGRHHRIAGHMPARDGAALAGMLADALGDQPHDPPYAATGLAAAWCYGRFAGFRTASMYVHAASAADVLADVGFRPTERGANVWLLMPNDPGVFQGVATHDGVHCVSPVQLYLDLHAHPERAEEVALEVKSRHLNWDDRT